MTVCDNSGLPVESCPCPDCHRQLIAEMQPEDDFERLAHLEMREPSKAWQEVLATKAPNRRI